MAPETGIFALISAARAAARPGAAASDNLLEDAQPFARPLALEDPPLVPLLQIPDARLDQRVRALLLGGVLAGELLLLLPLEVAALALEALLRVDHEDGRPLGGALQGELEEELGRRARVAPRAVDDDPVPRVGGGVDDRRGTSSSASEGGSC